MNTSEYQQLRQEIVRLKQEIAIRPIRVPTRGGAAPAAGMNVWLITGVNNQLLPSTLNGIKWISTQVVTTTKDYSNLLVAAANPTDTGIGICKNAITNEHRLVTTFGSVYTSDVINATLVSLRESPLSLAGVDSAVYSVYQYFTRF